MLQGAGNDKAARTQKDAALEYGTRLASYRMPFAWTARPVFSPNKILDNGSEFSPLFRLDKTKLSDEDMLRTLAEFHRNRSSGKLKLPVLPGHFVAKIHPLSSQPNYLDPSYVPVAPYTPSEFRPCRELQALPTQNADHPLMSYHNFLYVYPVQVDFTNAASSGNKARNIVCRVELLPSDESSTPMRAVYGRSYAPRFTTRAMTTVSYHNPVTSFYDEIKLALPVHATARHHLLFTFIHVTVDSQKKDKTETVIGYSCVPLVQEQGRLDGEFDLAVMAPVMQGTEAAPPGNYARASQPGNADRTGAKFIDGGKPLFKVRTVCVSSVYTRDDHLRRFYRALQNDDGSESAVRALRERIKALHAVHPNDLMLFFPVIFNTLFELLTRPSVAHSDAQLEVLKFLIFEAEFIRESGRMSAYSHRRLICPWQRARAPPACCCSRTCSTSLLRRCR